MRLQPVVALISALVLLVPIAQAGSVTPVTPPASQTVTIQMNDYQAFSFTGETAVSLSVQTGGNIDVYVTTQAGYNDYVNPSAPSFEHFVALSQENVNGYSKTISESGAIYVIVDNDDVTSGATPTGPVTISASFTKPAIPSWAIGLIILIVILVAVVGIRVALRRRKAARAPPPPVQPPPMQPPQSPPPP